MPSRKSFYFAALCLGLLSVSGCGGSFIGGVVQEYAYVATPRGIAQYKVRSDGQLLALPTPLVGSASELAIVSSRDRHVYAINADHTISQYAVGAGGNLVPLAVPTITVGSSPVAIAVNARGNFAYVLDSVDGTISEFSVASDGSLTPLSTPTVAVVTGGNALKIAQNGNFLYTASYFAGKICTYTIASDGHLSPSTIYDVATPKDIAITPNSLALYVAENTTTVAQFSVGSDGSLKANTPPTVDAVATGTDTIVPSPDGRYVYVGSFNGGSPASPVSQFSIASNGGLVAQNPPSVPAGNAPAFMIFDANETFFYVVNTNDGTISEFKLGGSGKLSPLNPALIDPGGARQIAFARH